MADSKAINWAYPFKTTGETSKEVSDPQVYFDALAKAKDGFYPMGANGLWHGGVHFDASTAALLDQSEVRCIADGEVIAYRIDDKYPESLYGTIQPGSGPAAVGAKYSTGFVLVKHRLELPAAPPTPTPEATGATTPSATAASPTTTPADSAPVAERLTFYSLYMHLLDWTGYQATNAPKPPEFLAPTQYSVKNTSSDPLLGLRVRILPSGGDTEVLALLPKGCKVTLGEASSTNPNWKQLLSVDEGSAVPSLPADTIGWVYASELSNNTVADMAKDHEPTLTLSHQGLNVRKEGKFTGAIIGVLPRGATLKVGAKEQSGYCKVLEVMDYRGVPALPNGADSKPLGYVYFEQLEAQQSAPSNPGAVHLLPEPHSIKAGELIGHIGLYQDHDEGTTKPRLHLEVFSCEDVPAFIAKSRTLAASLPADQKTLLKIHRGASKLIPHSEAITASSPPKITDAGVTIEVGLTIPVSMLESLPAELKIQVSETVVGSTAPHVTRWWRLDNLLADGAGNRISGWLAEQDLITSRHSAWEWEGFDFISETACAVDQFACHLDAQRLLTEEEKPDYQGQISTADHGPIKERLYDIIDGADGSVRDEILSVDEIKAALDKPWHAQSISRLITHYESEWFWKEEKWDELDKLMEHTAEDPNPHWVIEKERIKTLSWWSELAGKQGLNADGGVWHFHPMGIKNIFPSSCSEKCRREVYEMETTAGTFAVSKKLFEFILEIESYSEFPYALPDDTSGITIAYGYDLGQQTAATIDEELSGLYTVSEIETLKTALGKKGAAARSHLAQVSSIAISKENALKLAVIMKKRYAQQVVDIYPASINLHPDCQGALLSLVINRGKALAHRDPENTSRLEMKQIHDDFEANNIHLIPSRFRSMKRLWENNPAQRGVATRRENEAVYFEEALKCSCWK